MKDPFLEDCGGWTPAPDVLTKKYGFESAYLWGRLRRLCQLGKGTYTISPEALGKRFGMSRRTVIDRLKAMIQDGYIEDLTPGVRNKAHTYSVKKGEDKILAGMQISHTEDDYPTETPNPDASESDVGMRKLHSEDAEIAHPDDAGMQKLPKRYAKNAHPGMQNLHLNRESLETLKDTPNGVVGKPTSRPKTRVKDAFENLTGLKMPTAKTEEKAWWGWYSQILGIGGDDPDRAIEIMTLAVEYMDDEGLTINKPKSIIDFCRAVAAGRPLVHKGQNGQAARASPQRPLDAEKAARYREIVAERQKVPEGEKE